MSMRKWMIFLASATNVALFATPHEAAAEEQVRAYVLFDLAEAATDSTVEELRSASLGNCKQLPLEQPAYKEVILHLDCYEPAESNEYLSQAVVQLAGIDGVRQATVLFVKAGSE
jgi:hypothetical protein